MDEPADASIAWYDANGQSFFDRSNPHAHLEAERGRFAALLPEGGAILDAGCGSGRDARAFAEAGFDVTAFDGSAEMVRLAGAHTGLAVRQLRFEEMDWEGAFDGVWAPPACCTSRPTGLPTCSPISTAP